MKIVTASPEHRSHGERRSGLLYRPANRAHQEIKPTKPDALATWGVEPLELQKSTPEAKTVNEICPWPCWVFLPVSVAPSGLGLAWDLVKNPRPWGFEARLDYRPFSDVNASWGSGNFKSVAGRKRDPVRGGPDCVLATRKRVDKG
jgi:hypothetical protein